MMDEYLMFKEASEYKGGIRGTTPELKEEDSFYAIEDEEGKPATEFLPPFYNDIQALVGIYGFLLPGAKLELTLQEMLRICPRKRERSDAYNLLKAELKRKYDVDLIITSRKKNFKNEEDFER